MLDERGMQVHYRKGTKVMVIKAFDGSLYCAVNDKDVHVLDEIPHRASKSKEFDDVAENTPKKRYVPPMNHPWKSKSFQRFIRAQQHHLCDDISA